MRIQELLPVYLGGASEVIEVGLDGVDLWPHLPVPEGATVRHRKRGVDDAGNLELGPGTLLVSLLGPSRTAHLDPDALAPVLRRLQPGVRSLLLLGWPIAELPYHRLLGPLVDGGCQVVEALPLDRLAAFGGVHGALVVECVDKLAPLRAYLTDIPTQPGAATGPGPDAVDELRTVLRVANEYVLGDLVARPMRSRLTELTARVAEQDTRIRQLERQLTAIRTSATFQIGNVVVENMRHPVRAVIVLPRDLARMWRVRRSRRRPTGAAAKQA